MADHEKSSASGRMRSYYGSHMEIRWEHHTQTLSEHRPTIREMLEDIAQATEMSGQQIEKVLFSYTPYETNAVILFKEE